MARHGVSTLSSAIGVLVARPPVKKVAAVYERTLSRSGGDAVLRLPK